MTAMNAKLLRDLWRMKGQVLAIALVIGSGVALLVMALSSLSSLKVTADAYYERYRFADVFANATRVPEHIAGQMAAIPGVQTVETRVVAYSTVDLPGVAPPVMVRLISLPNGRQSLLNRIAVRAGRLPVAGRDDEAVVHEPFAQAHGLVLGDTLSVLMNGARRDVRIVGIALSPEFVYAIAPGGLMPDDAHFGLLWMGRGGLAAAYDLDSAFNDVSLSLLRGVNPQAVIERLDPILDRYGGTGAIARADQLSNWFLMNELKQQRTQATVLPAVFLTVAAFLTYTVLGRMIATERREISLMKAFGYSNAQIGLHYSGIAVVIAVVGIVLGWGAGAYLGHMNTVQYASFFRFPFLFYRPTGAEFALSAAISLGVALVGALGAVRAAVALQPAEAMRPPAPEMFRTAALPDTLARHLDNPTRMILRQIARAPGRSAITVIGVALSVGVLVLALQWTQSINALARGHFQDSQHQDMVVGFHENQDIDARFALARLPGVLAVEPMRIVPATLRAGARSHRGGVTGLPQDADLQVIHDVRGARLPVPRGGLVIGSMLAEKLEVGPGDRITIEVLEGARQHISVPVSAVFETYIDLPAYMDFAALNRAMGDPPTFRLASLLIDPDAEGAFFARLKDLPGISAVMIKRQAVESFLDTLGEVILIFVSFFVAFSGALSFGVIYNATRIALSERGRDLATLRVLGFSRWDISYILLGEAALLVLVALPLGCLAGYGLIHLIAAAMETELFRLPTVVHPSAFGQAIAIVLAACALSAAVVRRRLDRLDLIAVLKTRE